MTEHKPLTKEHIVKDKIAYYFWEPRVRSAVMGLYNEPNMNDCDLMEMIEKWFPVFFEGDEE